MKKKNILIIDDNNLLAKTLANYFVLKGFEVFVFSNIDELKKFVKQKKIKSADLAIVDFNLEENVNGIELAFFLEKVFEGIKIILVSGYFPEEYLKSSEEIKKWDLVFKPFDINRLEEILQKNNILLN